MTIRSLAKNLLLTLLVVLISASSYSQRKKVGLVLSGGGAKGAAHIGVLKVLEEHHIPIDYIAGTSMGAIVGGLYAVGYSVNELDSLIRAQEWTQLLSDNVARKSKLFQDRTSSDRNLISLPLTKDHKLKLSAGIVGGQSVYNMLSSLTIGYHDSISFDSLPTPFACVAYDIAEGKEVVLRSGDLPKAIRASMSIPGAFMPVFQDGKVLIDGGISNNMPVDVVRKMGAEVVIVVDIAAGMRKSDDINSLVNIVDQLTTIMGQSSYKRNLDSIDLYLKPNIAPYTFASFNKAAIDTLIDRGEICARANSAKIDSLKRAIGISENETFERPPMAYNPVKDSIEVGKILIEGLEPDDAILVRNMIRIKDNSHISMNRLNGVVEDLRGSGLFENVSFKLYSRGDNKLVFHLEEGSKSSLNVGFRFDSEESAAILLNTNIAFKSFRGSTIDLTARLSSNPYVKVGYGFSTNTFLKNMGISYMFRYNDNDIYFKGEKTTNVTFYQHLVDLNFTGFYVNRFGVMLGSYYEYLNYSSILFSESNKAYDITPKGYLSYYVRAQLETLDNFYFPRKGVSIYGEYSLTTDNGLKYGNKPPFGATSFDFVSAISVSHRVTFVPSVHIRFLGRKEVAYPYINFIGGAEKGRYRNQQIPFVGINYIEPTENSIAVGGLDLRVRLWRNNYVYLQGNYANASTYISNILNSKDILGGGIKYSYDSIIGPISVSVNSSTHTKKLGLYFSLGRNF